MPPLPEADVHAVPRSGVALGLLTAGVVLFLAPLTMAVVATVSGGSPAVVWGAAGLVTSTALVRITQLGVVMDTGGLTIRNPVRTKRLPWADIATLRWQCLKAGALDQVLPPNCRLLVEPRVGPGVAVQATVYVTADQRDAIERVMRKHAPSSVRAFTRQSPEPPSSPSSS